MNSSRRTLLSLSPHHCHAYAWDGDRLSDGIGFDDTAAGHEEFAAYLLRHPEPAYLMVDVIEEDFRQESVPHLTGRKRREQLTRKLEQHYRDTPFRLSVVQYRHAEGRRDDEILFSALTSPQHFSPWLDALSHAHIPLVGLYSLPHIETRLLNEILSEHALLLSWERHAGLRQSYFQRKKLRLSRLTPVIGHEALGDAIATEMPRMEHFLNSLNLPPRSETLDVYIICRAGDWTTLENELPTQQGTRYRCLDIQALCDSTKACITCQDSDATPLFLNLLVRETPAHHYAGSQITRRYSLWRLRRILMLLAPCILLLGSLWSSTSIRQAQGHAAKIEPLLEQADKLARQSAELRQRFPHTAAAPADMKAAVTAMRTFAQDHPAPEAILFGLSKILDQFTRIQLRKIAWRSDGVPAIDMDADLPDFGNNYRAALAYLEEFQQALARHGYTVTARQMPLGVAPNESISRDMQDDSAQPTQFTLQLVWRTAP